MLLPGLPGPPYSSFYVFVVWNYFIFVLIIIFTIITIIVIIIIIITRHSDTEQRLTTAIRTTTNDAERHDLRRERFHNKPRMQCEKEQAMLEHLLSHTQQGGWSKTAVAKKTQDMPWPEVARDDGTTERRPLLNITSTRTRSRTSHYTSQRYPRRARRHRGDAAGEARGRAHPERICTHA